MKRLAVISKGMLKYGPGARRQFVVSMLDSYQSIMAFHHTIRGQRYTFGDLRELFAKANEPKSGDQLAGLAATSELERAAAKLALADVPLSQIMNDPLIDPNKDDVSKLILDQ